MPHNNKSSTKGNILVNKPPGLTSFQCVKKIRYLTKAKKVGHAGTLDPFANGLLIVAVGKSFTTQISKFVSMPKTYWTSMICGISTDILDSYGDIDKVEPLSKPLNKNKIKSVLKSFLGKQEQIPPNFSAKKIKGQRAYDLARKKKEICSSSLKKWQLLSQ